MKPLVVLILCLLVAGCGSNTEKITIPSPNEAASALPTTSTSTQASSTAPQASPSYPVEHFTAFNGVWPFTAQLATVTENPNGFPSSGLVPPPGYTVLMVQVNITSEITGRTVPVPELKLHCTIPSVQLGQEGQDGFDEGEYSPDIHGPKIALGDGQPHPWDDEWEIPEGANTSELSCELDVGIIGEKDYTTVQLT